ncbi:head-tail connector protein [Aeromonas caviae]
MEVEYKITAASDSANENLITNDEIQSFLRLPEADPEIAILRDAAIRMAEKYMNRAITEQSGKIRSNVHSFRIPYIPLSGMVNITGVKSDNEEVLSYKFDHITGYFSVSRETSLPIVIDVSYEVESSIPAAIKLAIMKIIATEYEMRESVSVGVSVTEAPNSAMRILDLYRLPSGGIY